MARIRVLIADDHAIVREGVRALLTLSDDIEVAGEAANGQEAVELARRLRPDVILMDIAMPGVNGLEVLRFLRRDPLTARVPVVIVTAEGSPALKRDAFAAGANAFLLKPPSLENLEKALDHVIIANPPA